MLKIALAIWLAGAGLDNATTYDFSAHYTPNIYQAVDGHWFRIREGNPIYAGLSDHPAALTATLATTDAVTYWALHKWVEPHNRKTAVVVYLSLAAERFAVSAINLRAMHNADQAVQSVPAQITNSVHPTNGLTLYARTW